MNMTKFTTFLILSELFLRDVLMTAIKSNNAFLQCSLIVLALAEGSMYVHVTYGSYEKSFTLLLTIFLNILGYVLFLWNINAVLNYGVIGILNILPPSGFIFCGIIMGLYIRAYRELHK